MALNHTSKFADLTDEQFRLIGKIVIEWSNIEFLQKQILCRLLVTNEFLGRTFTDQISAARVQEAIKEAIELQTKRYQGKFVSDSIVEELVSINNRVSEIRGKRNKFAHFCWSRSNDEEIFGTNFSGGMPDTKKHRKSVVTLNIDEMNTLYQKSYELVESLTVLLDKLPKLTEETIIKTLKAEQTAAQGLRKQPRNL